MKVATRQYHLAHVKVFSLEVQQLLIHLYTFIRICLYVYTAYTNKNIRSLPNLVMIAHAEMGFNYPAHSLIPPPNSFSQNRASRRQTQHVWCTEGSMSKA
jgi:hypothetical protein